MMVIIGAVCIIGTTTLLGFMQAAKLRGRPELLMQLRYTLQALEAEILYSQMTLIEASKQIAAQHQNKAGLLFALFSEELQEQHVAQEAWTKSVNTLLRQSSLKSTDGAVLHQFGTTLGAYDTRQQQKQIRLAMTHLAREEESAREQQRTYETMSKSLGFLSGCLLVLLLL
ncbi:stage III sporulation protein SpoIIIAB [Aureibacillus halotolerans]|uniref:Stage III sporulation protein AB n=1 Tax=Aureibacillus halotolerans TaxID=1508390 RepID=A0A4R6UAE8_9BACI|nr:stage III sporulation protein SpoIIIAB [Aureibacillus halotolerans]TDQ41655.1 stage III sporulation protein AB [Aureibacillus halotolerans]